jgi:hypothetical protein
VRSPGDVLDSTVTAGSTVGGVVPLVGLVGIVGQATSGVAGYRSRCSRAERGQGLFKTRRAGWKGSGPDQAMPLGSAHPQRGGLVSVAAAKPHANGRWGDVRQRQGRKVGRICCLAGTKELTGPRLRSRWSSHAPADAPKVTRSSARRRALGPVPSAHRDQPMLGRPPRLGVALGGKVLSPYRMLRNLVVRPTCVGRRVSAHH